MVTVYYHSHHHNVPFRFMNVCAHTCRCVCVCWRKVVIPVCILKPDNNPGCSFLGTIFLCCLRLSPTSLEAPKLAKMARQQVLGICLLLLLSAEIISANNCVWLFPTWFLGVRLESLWLTLPLAPPGHNEDHTKIQFFKVALPKPRQLPSAHSNLVICVIRDAAIVMGLKDALWKLIFIFIIKKLVRWKT